MAAAAASVRSLTIELISLQKEPVEGFTVSLDNEDDMYLWRVAIFGPPETPYEGGYFKALIKFPLDYPYSPPSMKFVSPIFHPNVYEDGEVCISILHPPIDDPHSGELPAERWNPTQTVRTILLSVISLLNEPNTSSAANVDASVMYRKWVEKKDDRYVKFIRKQVESSKSEAAKDGIQVPTTREEYCKIQKEPTTASSDICDEYFYDDYHYQDDDEDDDYVDDSNDSIDHESDE
ncbi:ubiquitin-conjugating enzyme E2 R2-like [Dysidea avara]|uniref:ubiquitin-conjugating enzyme E2 R2-like n=1 Tax=Dysidea avara TaxID=196820 RepID=UPI00331F7876